jgi:hypothetical protein
VTYQFANTRFGLFTADVAKGVKAEDRNRLEYKNFTSYKNQKGGAWVESAKEHLTNCVFADQPVGVLSTANANLNRVVIVGQTENTLGEALPTRGKDERSKQPVGIRFNKRNAGNQFELTNLTVINCPVGLLATSAAPSGHVKGCKFENVPIRFYSNGKVYGSETKLDKMVLRDDDGSLTGLGTPAQITLVRVSEKSKERKDWNVFVTPK